MYTFVIDSRFVNAAIYLLFDVGVFFLLSLSLQTLQSKRVARRLRNGDHIQLRESFIGMLAGGFISDGSVAAYLCMAVHFSLLLTLFLLALGINGRSQLMTQRTNREYITRIAAGDDDYNPELHSGRLRPQLFSDCKQHSGSSLTYYPTAFDTEGNTALHDLFAFTDEQGESVNINASTTLCQKQGSFAPMLVVRRCGDNVGQCSNIQITNTSSVRVLGASENGAQRWQKTIHVRTGNAAGRLLVMYRNIEVVDQQTQCSELCEYNRVICRERPLQGEERPPSTVFMNCVAGVWNANGSLFTFHLAELTLARGEAWDALNNGIDHVAAELRSTSAPMEVEWEARQHGETLFADSLTAVGQDLVSPRWFLDSVVGRTVVAARVTADDQVLQEVSTNVTDVERAVGVVYVVLAALSAAAMTALALARGARREGVLPDVTSYSGLSELLLRAKGGDDDDSPGALASAGKGIGFELCGAGAASSRAQRICVHAPR